MEYKLIVIKCLQGAALGAAYVAATDMESMSAFISSHWEEFEAKGLAGARPDLVEVHLDGRHAPRGMELTSTIPGIVDLTEPKSGDSCPWRGYYYFGGWHGPEEKWFECSGCGHIVFYGPWGQDMCYCFR